MIVVYVTQFSLKAFKAKYISIYFDLKESNHTISQGTMHLALSKIHFNTRTISWTTDFIALIFQRNCDSDFACHEQACLAKMYSFILKKLERFTQCNFYSFSSKWCRLVIKILYPIILLSAFISQISVLFKLQIAISRYKDQFVSKLSPDL